MENFVSDWILPSAIFAQMLGMGLALTPGDFRRVLAKPTPSLLGTILQLVLMPVVGVGIALGYALPPLLAAGLVILAACPGGMFSNILVHLARANTALSITLTGAATLVTLFTLPLWVRFILSRTGEAGASIDMPVFEAALELGAFTVLPLATGMLLRSWWPDAASREAWLSRGAVVVIVAAMVFDYHGRELPIAEFRQSLIPALLLTLAGLAAGLLIPPFLRVSARDTATIAVELVVKNGLLALVIARHSFGFEATAPIIAFAIFQTPIAALVLLGWRLRLHRAGSSGRAPRTGSGNPPLVARRGLGERG